MSNIAIYHGDNLAIMQSLADSSFEFVYIDPPFNTGTVKSMVRQQMYADAKGDRTGFGGKRYRTVSVEKREYSDMFGDYLQFLKLRLVELQRLLTKTGSIFVHLDYREVHYVKVMMDEIFGRDSFMNEIIWAYDYGARSKKKWSVKHNNILWYAKDPKNYTFNFDAMDRIPYMAPSLVTPEKAARGKTPTDVHWHTIVPTNGRERTGYPTQKPLGLINRFVKVHTNPGDRLLDCFAGSGTLGESAAVNGRSCVLIDSNFQAVEAMNERLNEYAPIIIKI